MSERSERTMGLSAAQRADERSEENSVSERSERAQGLSAAQRADERSEENR
ncbi:hypothetical protein Cci01nite_49110 [Catellatospora citrea]|uniref:Uncharacterized protein n=1 Tax=Catellatospora citrea TaxID=53366 RepID=A0A8J3KHB6_9ACTN|nr:hypothetical protein Cci01nite_49110 [Catellatospora citrea]